MCVWIDGLVVVYNKYLPWFGWHLCVRVFFFQASWLWLHYNKVTQAGGRQARRALWSV